MIYKIFYQVVSLVLILIVSLGSPIIAGNTTDELIAEKRERVVMRTIGHELLKCLGDETSRVLPIEKYDEHYKISFEFEFGFDPDDVVSIVDHVLSDSGLAVHCVVEVVQCQSGEVAHSFEINNGLNREIIACQGRVLPQDCYDILVTIIDDTQTQNVVLLSEDNQTIPFKAALLIVPLIILIGYAGYSAWKSEEVQDNSSRLKLGSIEFDQKNMTLKNKNQIVELSHKEGMLLSVLIASANETVKREDILQKVWGDEGDYIGRTLDVFISKLRKKLDLDANLKVVNIRGVGYKLVV